MIKRPLPEKNALLAGYSYLIDRYELSVPEPFILSAIGTKHSKYKSNGWQIYTPRHKPSDDLYGNLVFAIKYEGIDLAVLNALFNKIDNIEIEKIITNKPSSKYAKRIWFLFEYLTGYILNIPDTTTKNYAELLDSKIQYVGPLRASKRHKIYNNLPGVKDFCPIIRRTEKLDELISQNLSQKIVDGFSSAAPNLIARAASFILLEDSKASYAIEGETPPQSRAQSWGSVIGKAGTEPLSKESFESLQKEIITDKRFYAMGYRKEGGFVGTHEMPANIAVPSHISARHEDVLQLIDGLIQTAELLKKSDYPPVLTATLIAFGFVFIHPFEDGNGRLHRYILHHILVEHGFTPKGLIFPISSIILKYITEYAKVLKAYSEPRLPLIKWRPTPRGNVEVLNETIDLYRFFDATPQAEFLYECVYETITKALPDEISYLQKYDAMQNFINNYLDMPDRTSELLINFLHQNKGKLSKRARKKEFSLLTDEEVKIFEDKFVQIFDLEDQ